MLDHIKTESKRIIELQQEQLSEMDFNVKQITEMKMPYMEEKLQNALDYVKGRGYLADILERLMTIELKFESIDRFETSMDEVNKLQDKISG